ncbi:MAG: IS110 family transposase [Pyrinomonadaceae bacterium]
MTRSRSSARYVGLDVQRQLIVACSIDARGHILLRQSFACTHVELESFARRHLHATDKLALEATTNTWELVARLKPFVAEVVVSNPLKTRLVAEARVKTDKVDALILAQLLRCDFLPRVWEPGPEVQRLRRLTARRASLVLDKTAVKNRIHSLLHQRLVSAPVKDLFCGAGRRWLASLVLDEEGREALDSDLGLLARLEEEVARQDQLLTRRGYADPRVRLLMTLPGVDLMVAQTLLAALGDASRFSDGDRAASSLGLVPRTRQSAARCYHGPITKCGSGHARAMLVQAAQHVGAHPGPLGAFFRRIARRKSRNVAVVATARKLVCIAWQMLATSEPYRYAQPRVTRAKLARLRCRGGGERRPTGMPKGVERGAASRGRLCLHYHRCLRPRGCHRRSGWPSCQRARGRRCKGRRSSGSCGRSSSRGGWRKLKHRGA